MTFFGYDGADIPRCGNSPRSRALSAPVSRSAARSASSRAHSCGRRRLVRSALAALLLGCSASVLPGVVLAQVDLNAQGIESTEDAVEMGEEASQASVVGVTLSLEPSINRTVMITNSDPGAVTVSPGSLTFTPTNWNMAQLFHITPVQDADANDESVTLTLSGDELTSKTVTVTIIDDDRELALTPSAVTVTEGGTATFAVRLASLPGRDTIVAVSSGNTGAATVNLPSLTFTPMTWNTAQTVTVTGVQDTDTSDEQVTITLSGDGVVTGTVTVNVTDNDTAQVTGVTVDEGDAQLVVNWTAVDNATGYTVQWKSGGQGYNTGDRQATSGSTTSHTIEGLANGTEYTVRVIATRTDANDGPPSAEVTGTTDRELALTPSAVTVTEGGTATFAVRLASLPGRDTIVAVSSGNTGAATVNPPSLTFTPMTWNTAQTVTVTGVQDTDTSDEQVTITLSGDGVVTGTVTVDVTDNDNTAQVTGVTVDAGDAQLVVNWTAVDNATGYTVQWKSGGQGYNTGDRQATVTPGSTTGHTIEGLANGTEYTVRVIATRTDANDGPPSAEVTGTTDRELALTPSAVTVTEGGTATFAVRLASLPGRDTIVAVSSGNTGAATVNLPSLTFTPMTWNTAQTVTVTGVKDIDTSDEQVTITLSGDGVVTGTVTVNVTDNDTAQVTGVTVDEGDAQLVVNWTAVDNATGYTVQWKSGGQGYNTGDRQATVTPGSTTSHTIEGLANGTEYTVRVIATRTDANDGPPSAEVTGTTEMIPVPTPTLPEIALLLLAMLLLGSGVYLLRGRQSGGLTHA